MARWRTDWVLWGIGGVLVLGLLLAPLWVKADKPPPSPDKPPPTPTPSEPAHETNPLASADAEDGETLFRLIVAEQEKNLAKIRTIKFTFTEFRKVMVPGDEHEATTERRIIRSGESVWCEMKSRSHFFNSNKGQSHTDYIVWNDKALIYWPSDTRMAYLWEYMSVDNTRERVRKYMKMAFAFPELRYAFGYGPHSLREMLDDPDKQELRYQVMRTADDKAPGYTVVVLPPERIASHPIMRLTVDPARGYMVTYRVDFLEDGTVPHSEYWVVPREVSPGVWLPERWEERIYGRPLSDGNRQTVNMLFQDRIEVQEVNAPISEEQFAWQAAGMNSGTEVYRFDVSDDASMMRIVDGELVEKALRE